MIGRLRLRRGGVAPPDYTIDEYSDWATVLANDLSNKTVLVVGDTSGAAITITNKTWPGLTIKGTSATVRGLMPRLILNNVDGGSGAPITWKWLEWANVKVSAAGSEGQITCHNTESRYHRFTECKIHDDPFTSKIFPWTQAGGDTLAMYRGFTMTEDNTTLAGRLSDLEIDHCEIYNQYRSLIDGDNVHFHDNLWHDHYMHACTTQGNNWTIEDERCWNIWASGTDYGAPHAGNSFSPTPTFGDDGFPDRNTVSHHYRRIVALIGDARYQYARYTALRPEAEWYPSASGIKFNDMYNAAAPTPRYYEDCWIEDSLIIGNDSMMAEINAPLNSGIRGCTLVHDLAQNEDNNPSFVTGRGVSLTVSDNVLYAINPGPVAASRPPTTYVVNNANADPDSVSSDNLVAYAVAFTGPSFDLIDTPEAAISAFTLNPSSPYSSWTKKPGYLGQVGRTYSTIPTTVNVTSQALSTVSKPNTCFVQANPSGSTAPWIPSNSLQKGGLIVRFRNSDAIDGATTFALGATGSIMTLERQSTDTWRLGLERANGDSIVYGSGSVFTSSADGMVTFVAGWDLTQGKVRMAILANGNVMTDFPGLTSLRDDYWDAAGMVLMNVGASPTASSSTTTAWVDQCDIFGLTDAFLDLDDATIYGNLINTSGELASLGTAGTTIGIGTWAIWLQGNAAAWNGTNFNAGNGVDGLGNPTVFNYVGGAPEQFT